jgi:sugar phosphate isomerase/epimerase
MTRKQEKLREDLSYIMPFSNVLHLPFEEKLRASQLAGFQALAMQPQEIQRIKTTGVSISDMKKMAADHNIAISRLDPLCAWNPRWEPVNMGSDFIIDHSISTQAFLEMCQTLGCTHMSLNATFVAGAYSLEQQVQNYAEICRLAGEFGLVCDLEPIPMWGVQSLEQGWEIVRQAQAPNGGLVFDTLHFVRGNSKLETLAAIPGDLIHCVQICDGIHPLENGVTLESDCFNRMWPGTGNFPLREIVATLERTQGLNQVGPEVFSVQNESLSAERVAQSCLESLRHFPELLDTNEIDMTA